MPDGFIQRVFKRLTTAPPVPAQSAAGWRFLPRSYRNYQRDVGDGSNSSIVLACVNWVCRNFPEAPLKLETKEAGDDYGVVGDHAIFELMERPNPFYSGILLWYATLFDWTVYGNALAVFC